MYGIVNKAIEELVIHHFGEVKWETIKARSGIDVDYFISIEPYDDDITYKLAQATSEEMSMPVSEVLKALGRWWILKTAKEKYGSLLSSGGENFKAFLLHLPDFHNRIMLMYPKLTPPEFKISDIHEYHLNLHYYSVRAGLSDFVYGLLEGLASFYDCEVDITLVASRDLGHDHEIFRVKWKKNQPSAIE